MQDVDWKKEESVINRKNDKGLSFLARVERLELPTPGFGDQCSTN
jgi:hypothetical protein